MTAEIAVMNREAVALAADSASTTNFNTGSKVVEKLFKSCDKLFQLSKYHPIAIMFYGYSHFMDVPWDTIIKVYRKGLGDNNFATVREYANDFIRFLNRKNFLFPEKVQEEYAIHTIAQYFTFLKEAISQKLVFIADERNIVIDAKERTRLFSGYVNGVSGQQVAR